MVAGLRERRQEEILAGAARLFAQHGYVQTDTQMLSDTLGIAKGTIYRYFPSKAKLFHAVVDRGLERLRKRVEEDAGSINDPLKRIEQAIHSFLEHFSREPELVELFLQEMAFFKRRHKPAYFTHHELYAGPWRELYQSLIQAGRVRELRDAPDYHAVNDLLYGTIIANYVSGRRVHHSEQAHMIIDLLFHGMLTDAERRRRQR